MIYKFFDKQTAGGAAKNQIMQDKELAKELHKPTIRKFGKRKEQSSFINIICGTDLADMQLFSKFNKGIHFLLCVIDMLGLFL